MVTRGTIARGLLAALVVAVIAVTATLGVLFARAHAEEKARESALEAARLYTQKMYAWTPENISDNVNFMMAHLTGPAKKEYETNILEHRIAEQVKEQKVVATVTDQGAGVIENTRDTAKVLLFINQSASRATTEDIQVNPARVVFSMERRSGTWLVNEAQLINDETLEQLVTEQEGEQPVETIPVQPPAGEQAPPDQEAPPAVPEPTVAPAPTN